MSDSGCVGGSAPLLVVQRMASPTGNRFGARDSRGLRRPLGACRMSAFWRGGKPPMMLLSPVTDWPPGAAADGRRPAASLKCLLRPPSAISFSRAVLICWSRPEVISLLSTIRAFPVVSTFGKNEPLVTRRSLLPMQARRNRSPDDAAPNSGSTCRLLAPCFASLLLKGEAKGCLLGLFATVVGVPIPLNPPTNPANPSE